MSVCQLAFQYIANANARINTLSITAGSREYELFVAQFIR